MSTEFTVLILAHLNSLVQDATRQGLPVPAIPVSPSSSSSAVSFPSLPGALPFDHRTPLATIASFRRHLFHVLSTLLAAYPAPPILVRPLHIVQYPTSIETAEFIAQASRLLTDIRKRGLDKEEFWWRHIKGGVRKSDLSEARGPRYEQLMLAFSCTVVWAEIQRRISYQVMARVALTSIELELELPALLDAYSQLVDQAASTPLRHRAALEEIEKRWIDITRIKSSLAQVAKPSDDRQSLHRLSAWKDSCITDLNRLIESWCDLDNLSEVDGREISSFILIASGAESSRPAQQSSCLDAPLGPFLDPACRVGTDFSSLAFSLSQQLDLLRDVFQQVPSRLSRARATASDPGPPGNCKPDGLDLTKDTANNSQLAERWRQRLRKGKMRLTELQEASQTQPPHDTGLNEDNLPLWYASSDSATHGFSQLQTYFDQPASISMSDRVSDIRRSLQVSHAENPTSSMHAFLSRQHAKPLPQIVGTQPLGEIPSTSSACPAIKSIRLRHKAKERLPSIAPAAVPSAAKSNSHQRTPSKTRDRTRGVTVGTGRRTLSRAAMERAGSVTTMRKIRGNKPKVSGLFERGDEDEAGYIDVEDDPFGEQILDDLVTASPLLDTPARPRLQSERAGVTRPPRSSKKSISSTLRKPHVVDTTARHISLLGPTPIVPKSPWLLGRRLRSTDKEDGWTSEEEVSNEENLLEAERGLDDMMTCVDGDYSFFGT